jgi:hypothetical protein
MIAVAGVAKIKQTVRKLAICTETVDQNADFRVQSNFERSEVSKIEAKVRANMRPNEFSHGPQEFRSLPSVPKNQGLTLRRNQEQMSAFPQWRPSGRSAAGVVPTVAGRPLRDVRGWLIVGPCAVTASTPPIRILMRQLPTDPGSACVQRPARARLPGNRSGRGSTDRRQSRRRGRTRNIGR